MAIQLPNPGLGDGQTGDNEYVMWTKVKDNFSNTTHAASRLVGENSGNVMQVGAFGLGGFSKTVDKSQTDVLQTNGFYHDKGAQSGDMAYHALLNVMHSEDLRYAWQIGAPMGNSTLADLRARIKANGAWSSLVKIWNEHNTTKDSNGFLKGASPVVQLFADKIELNDEAKQQSITFEKLGVGDYLVKGSLGFAQEGWYIEMPKDANGNVLVAVVYEQLENNDISVKTYAKKFDEETGDVVANTAKPRDIPATRWIDLRLQALPQPTQPLGEDETVNTNAE